MLFQTPPNFFETLCDKYDDAVKSNNIVYSRSDEEVTVTAEESGSLKIPVIYELLASLLQRPEKGTVDKDPFARPEPELTVLDLYGEDGELKVVFNKYPVVPRHFLLVTRDFVSQNSPLLGSELWATYTLLNDLKEKDAGNRWFAFYNCGPESGALQPHKHIQFMTFNPKFVPYPERMAEMSEAFIPTSQKEPLQNKDVPFAHFVAPISRDPSQVDEDSLVMCFSSLLQRCLTVLRDAEAKHISFNVVITTNYIMLVPRSSNLYGSMGINSLGMLGMFMFKNQELIDTVKTDGPLKVMEACGFPSTAGQSTNEYHY